MDRKQARELGRQLRERREELNLTTRELAEKAGTSHTTVVRLEQGAYLEPRLDNLRALAIALELDAGDVLALADFAALADLPSFRPYLRTKYRGLPAPAVEEL